MWRCLLCLFCCSHDSKNSHPWKYRADLHISLFNYHVQEDFYAVVDWAYKIDPLRCISMHGITERYLSGQKADAAGFVRQLLDDLESRISMQFNRVSTILTSYYNNLPSLLKKERKKETETTLKPPLSLSHSCYCFLGCSLSTMLAIKLRGMNALYDKWEYSPIFQGICCSHCLINLSLCTVSMLCFVVQYVYGST